MADSQDPTIRLCHILASLNFGGGWTSVMPESFDKPNFNLVCDILLWCARIVDDSYEQQQQQKIKMAQLPEASRISFLINLGKLFSHKLGVQLNLVSLYKADRSSCPELLKLAEPICQAARLALDIRSNNKKKKGKAGSDCDELLSIANQSAQSIDERIAELSALLDDESCRELPTRISQLAEDLDSLLLSEEEHFNRERLKVMDRRLELPEIERTLRGAYEDIVKRTKELNGANGELEKDLDRLADRLAMKELEVQKAKERLDDLLLQSPAYLDRYNRLHKEYEVAYESYVSDYRNLTYLKWCVYSSSSSPGGGSGNGTVAVDHELTKPPSASGMASLRDELEFVGGGGLRPLDTAAATGPARLLESLSGASKPISTSLGVELGAKGKAGGEGSKLVATTGGGRGLATNLVAGAAGTATGATGGFTASTGLELEGLLSEFVADAEAEEADGESEVGLDGDDEDEDDVDTTGTSSEEPDGLNGDDDIDGY